MAKKKSSDKKDDLKIEPTVADNATVQDSVVEDPVVEDSVDKTEIVVEDNIELKKFHKFKKIEGLDDK